MSTFDQERTSAVPWADCKCPVGSCAWSCRAAVTISRSRRSDRV